MPLQIFYFSKNMPPQTELMGTFKVITSAFEAQSFTPGNFIAGGSWLSSIGVLFSLGL